MSTSVTQWFSRANEGFGFSAPGVRMMGSADFVKALDERYNLLIGSKTQWCDPSVLSLMKDQRNYTEHLITIADVGVPASPDGRVPATIKGLLIAGRDELHGDPEGTITLHAACANNPNYLLALLQTFTAKGRLSAFGIKQVNANIFPAEVLVYVRAGFRVVPTEPGATIDVVYTVPTGGRRRKSKSVRSKRIRRTHKNRSKQ